MAGFMDFIQGAFSGPSAQEQAEAAGLPPLTVEDYVRRQNAGGVIETGQQTGQGPLQGMEAFPFGPRGPGPLGGPSANYPVPFVPPGTPAVPGALVRKPPPFSGTVGGTPPATQGARPGVGRQGETYDGQFNYRDWLVPFGGGKTGATGGQGGQSAPGRAVVPGSQGTPATGGTGGGRTRRTNQTGQPRPDDGPTPMGGEIAGSRPQQLAEKNWFEKMWGGARNWEKAVGAGGLLGAAGEVGDMLGRIFGDDGVQAQGRPKLPWPDQQGSGSGGGSAFQMPKSYRAELEKMIPSVDYENLPRPPYEQVYQQMQSLAPEAPEERNFLDKLPTNMKNILGFGILLGPVGLLLGAGMGMAENQSIDKAEQEKFKQESRQHLADMLGFQLDWGKAERAMALEEQEGARDQAMGMLETDLALQNHELGLMQAQDQMATNASRRAAIQRDLAGGGQFDIDRLFQRAMMLDPAGTMQVWEGLRSADDAPRGLSGDQADTYNQMLKAAVVRALYE